MESLGTYPTPKETNRVRPRLQAPRFKQRSLGKTSGLTGKEVTSPAYKKHCSSISHDLQVIRPSHLPEASREWVELVFIILSAHADTAASWLGVPGCSIILELFRRSVGPIGFQLERRKGARVEIVSPFHLVDVTWRATRVPGQEVGLI